MPPLRGRLGRSRPHPPPSGGSTLATHAATDAGWATFGQAIPQGAVPSGQGLKLGSLDTQSDIKTTWDDGSARFAVVTASIPGAGDYDLTAASPATGSFTPAIPTASVTLTISGTAYTATMPTSVSSDPWLDGPNVREWRHTVAPTHTGTPHASLRVLHDVRVYSDGSARVDICVDNVLDVAGNTLVTYDVAMVVNGSPVFSQSSVAHYPFQLYRKVFGVGLTESYLTPDLTPWYAAKAIPKFAPTIASNVWDSSNTVDLGSGPVFALLKRGACTYDSMGATGGRPEIAPYPYWAAEWGAHRTANQRAYTLLAGDYAGSWPVHILQSDGTPISIDDRPDFWLDVRGVDDPVAADMAVSSGLTFDTSHVPSLAYIPYLISGDRFYADEVAYWAHFGLIAAWPAATSFGGRGGSEGIVGTEQVRGRAWQIRNLADAAAYLPDDHPSKDYLISKIGNNVDFYDGSAFPPTPIGACLPRIDTPNGPDFAEISQWQNNFLAWALDHAYKQGFGGDLALRDRIADFQLKMFASEPDFPRDAAGPYWPVVGDVSGGVTTYYTSMAEYYAKNIAAGAMTDPPIAFDGAYGISGRLALLMCLARSQPGAQDALDYLLPLIPIDLAAASGWVVDASDFT